MKGDQSYMGALPPTDTDEARAREMLELLISNGLAKEALKYLLDGAHTTLQINKHLFSPIASTNPGGLAAQNRYIILSICVAKFGQG